MVSTIHTQDAKSERQCSKRSGRLTWTAIIHGAAVAFLTTLLAAFAAGTIYQFKLLEMMLAMPAIGFSEVTALAGLGLYLVVRVIGTGLSMHFYHHFESRTGSPYHGMMTNSHSCVHLVLMNSGVAGASILMIYSAFISDFAFAPTEMGGYGMTMEQVSRQVLNPLAVPVASPLLVTVTGVLAGGAGFYRKLS